MRTVAFVGNRRQVFCCPACARSAAAQAHMTIRFESVADYASGRSLRPKDAFGVAGSNVVPCLRQHEMLNPDGQPMAMDYDRCSPSILAFASRSTAERFASEHGGTAGTFQESTMPVKASAGQKP
jgi:hypothetical protein